jgi:signal transduction histidine kinase
MKKETRSRPGAAPGAGRPRASGASDRPAEGELHRNLLEALLRELPVGVAVFGGEDLRVKWVNPVYLRFFAPSAPARTIIGLRPTEYFPPEYVEGARQLEDLLQRVATTGEPHVRPEFEYHPAGRAPSFWRWSVRPLPGSRAPRDVMLILEELTQQVHERKACEELEQEVRRKNEELAEAARRKDDFLAVLGHELRNPLAALGSASYLLDQASLHEPATAPFRQTIARQTAQLSRLVDDLLDVARISRGRIELRRGPVDLRDVVRRAIDASRHLINARQHALAVALPGAPLVVEGDAARLEQVLGNLLFNAAKYTEPGGQISVAATRAEDAITLTVKDTGLGIPAEVLPHVFDLFVQGGAGATRVQGGLGIGLSLVRSLVELHGGTVEARSAGAGRGSEFVVRLPLRPAAPAPAPRPVAAPAPRAERPRRVLIVDDDEDVADMLSAAVALWGHAVRVARDGPTALAAVAVDPPDVILLDLGLPGMDGYEVARRLKDELPETAESRIIALTGYGQAEDRRRVLEAGFERHLTKPVDLDELRRIIGA